MISRVQRSADFVIRRAAGNELDSIRCLVARVVAEVYGHLFPQGMPEDHTDWQDALVAVSGTDIVGVALTGEDAIDDLWISAESRRCGVGGALLAAAESEIRQRMYQAARLRVAADNTDARRFYAAQGWREAEMFPHEIWGFLMVNMTKDLTR